MNVREVGTAIVIMAAAVLAPAAAAAEDLPGDVVRFPSGDGDLTGGAPTMLEARLLRPAGPGSHPAIVLLHGCGGLYRRHGKQVNERDGETAERLRDQGYLVLMVDSFTPRGVTEICRLKDSPIRPDRERKRDAHAALEYLRSRNDVVADRIGLLGWSNGGSTVLAALGTAPPADYRAALAYYPGCLRSTKDPSWRLPIPLLVLTGDADDWTPAVYCQKLSDSPNASGRLTLVRYPGAYHGFDAPDAPVKEVSGLAGVKRGAAFVGTDPVARADSMARVDAYFAHWLKN